MIKGYRTYLTLVVLVVNKILQAMGFVEYSSAEIETAIDVILAVVAFVFRYLATKKGK